LLAVVVVEEFMVVVVALAVIEHLLEHQVEAGLLKASYL
jgi:hypothetical protein